MTPEERSLIDGLFDRMRGTAGQPRDAEAEALIARRVAENPAAPYALAQTVLVQEHALQQTYARMQELEDELEALRRQQATQPAQSGGFLGGLFGGGRTSVPPTGARAPGGPFGGPGAYAQQGYGQPNYPQQPGGPWGQPVQQAPARGFGGGGFLQGALATAAGVAGGALLYDGIKNMMASGDSPIAKEATAALDMPASSGGLGSDVDKALGGGNQQVADNSWNAEPDNASFDDAGFNDGGGWDGGGGDDSDWA